MDTILRFVGKRHKVLVEEPHPQSLASKVLLRASLYAYSINEWLEFRTSWLTKQKQLHGDLVCTYCGKANLLMEAETRAQLKNLATIDHVNPRANGGQEFDDANLVVACQPCNNAKADSTHLAHLGK